MNITALSAPLVPPTPSVPPGAPSASASGPTPTPPDPPRENTPYQKIKNSTVGRFVRENKVVSGIAGAGSWIVMAGAASKSPVFDQVARYGIVPTLGAGLAVIGATAVHDAFVNDLPRHRLRAAGKIASGTAATLGGTQIIGQMYRIPVLDEALTGTLNRISDNGQALAGAAVAAGGVAAGRFALGRFARAAEQTDHRAANVLLGVTSSAASAGGVLGGLELIGRQYGIGGLDRIFSNTIEVLGRSGVGATASGALLTAGSAVLAKEAVANFRRGGNDLVTVAEGMGAVSTGLGGVELLGHGLDIPQLQGLFTGHLDLIGSAALSSSGVAITRAAVSSARQKGLTLANTAAGTVGATAAVGGLSLAAYTFHLTEIGRTLAYGTEVAFGLGVGAVSGALARTAIREARDGDFVPAAASAAGAAVTGVASLGFVGHGLGIEAVSRAADRIFEKALIPAYNHTIEPAARFLFQNPVAGAVALAVGVGAYAWYRNRHKP